MSENITAYGLKKRALLAAFRETGNVRLACETAGVGRSSHYRWLEADAAYQEAFELAKEDAADILEAEARRRSTGRRPGTRRIRGSRRGREKRTRSVGRPTDYDPSFCDRVVDLGGKGYSKAMTAAELGVVRQTLDNWASQHPDFLDAMTRAREFALAWWERQGHKGIWSRDFNANAYRLQIVNRFPDDWREPTEVQRILARIDLSLLPDHLLDRIVNGEHPLAVLASGASDAGITPKARLSCPRSMTVPAGGITYDR